MKRIFSLIVLTFFAFTAANAQTGAVNPPSGLAVSDLDVSQATLHWDRGADAQSWQVRYKVFQQEEYTYVSVSDTVVYLQQLSSGTRYLWSVRAIDQNEDTSAWSGTSSFTTLGFDSGCPLVQTLNIANMDAGGISVQWSADAEAQGFEAVAGEVGSNPDLEGLRVQTPNYNASFSGLTAGHRYQFAVRSLCGSVVGDWRYIYAKYLPYSVQDLPVQLDFETENDNQNVGFVNSAANAWEIGSATNASSLGSRALYISDNGGETNACDNSIAATSYAYIDFYVPDNAVGFYIDFKYKTQTPLQGASLKVFLVSPGSAVSIDGTPSAAEQVGEGAYLGGNNTWQNVHIELPEVYIGTTQRILFVWENASNAANTSAVAVDDIYITARYCATPANLRAESTGPTSAILAWDVRPNQAAYNMEYKPTAGSEWTLLEGVMPNNVLENLQSSTSYTFRVQADCSDEQSFWSDTAVFSTNVLILPPTDVALTGFTESSATVEWTAAQNAHLYLVEAVNSVSQTIVQGQTSLTSIELSPLAENALYEIRLRAVSIDSDTSVYTPSIYVHTLCNPVEQFPYLGPDSVKYTSEQGFCVEDDCWRISSDTVFSPVFNLSASATPVLSFDFSTSGLAPQLLVSVGGSAFTPLLQSVSTSGNILRLNDYMQEERVRFAFRAQSIEDLTYAFNIMNFAIKDSCFAPDNLTVNHIGATSAVVEWTAFDNNTAFVLKVVNPATNDTTTLEGVSSPYTLENLSANTSYTLLLGAMCGEVSAETSALITFSTEQSSEGCDVPTNFVCEHYQSKGDETIVCTWDNDSDNPYMHWEINYKEALAVEYSSATVSLTPRFTLRNLELGSRWEFRLRAICSIGDTSDWTAVHTVLVGNEGLDATEVSDSFLKVYPNPADKVLHIETNAVKVKDAQLIDATGRVVKAWDTLPNQVDISSCPKGVYYLNLSLDGKRVSRKINIQ